MAAAAGYVAGHVAFPALELGAAYDRAMAERVFGPLKMDHTTFDFSRALSTNHAAAHAPDVDDKPALAVMDVNYAIVPVRPAGGAWSNVARRAPLRRRWSFDAARCPTARVTFNDVPLARAARASGPDRQGRDVWDGPRG